MRGKMPDDLTPNQQETEILRAAENQQRLEDSRVISHPNSVSRKQREEFEAEARDSINTLFQQAVAKLDLMPAATPEDNALALAAAQQELKLLREDIAMIIESGNKDGAADAGVPADGTLERPIGPLQDVQATGNVTSDLTRGPSGSTLHINGRYIGPFGGSLVVDVDSIKVATGYITVTNDTDQFTEDSVTANLAASSDVYIFITTVYDPDADSITSMTLEADLTRPSEEYDTDTDTVKRVIGVAKTDSSNNVMVWDQKQFGNIVISGTGGSFALYNYWYDDNDVFYAESSTEPAGLLTDGASWLSIINVPNGDDPAVPANTKDIVLYHYQKCIPLDTSVT